MQQSAFGGVVVRAREALVGPQASGPLHDVEVILPIDGQAADRTDGPVLGQRLRKRRVVLEDRNLYFLSLTDEVMLPGPDQHERDAQRGLGDSLQMHAPEIPHYRGSANTYTALAPLAVSASGVTTVCVAAIGPPPAVMAMN